ncbi:RNA polymerase factor sigma-54 [Plastorhodobacter daqingensis]|uniref:RNA polymerase sigma-54 factor n=1 Tax=Plastorhodobacter daqingensis TaxID=1387281 RepID=A0ABW2UGC2_9RHOB
MQLVPVQQLRQKQSLVVTAQLQQAIVLLQMNNLELRSFIEQQAEENPFLDTGARLSEAPARPETPLPSGVDQGMQAGAALADGTLSGLAQSNLFDSDRGGRQPGAGGDAPDAVSLLAAGRPSLYAHVGAAMDLMLDDPRDRAMAEVFLEALEPSGWLGRPLDQIAALCGCDMPRAEALLERLQQMEPAGLFARDLAECLRLQAADRGWLTPVFAALLDNLALLGAGQMRQLARACGCESEALRPLLRQLRSLDPKPGAQFSHEEAPLRAPDLIVRRAATGWQVDLNRSTLPSVLVNEDYAARATARRMPEDVRRFASGRVADARWLRRAVAQRNDTALRVGAEIVRHQEAFLLHGPAHLRPLILREVADAIGVHESTVSRVTTGMMMATPQGSFPLKFFFSAALSAADPGQEAGSAAAIRYRIRRIIEGEPADAPLSDDAIVEIIAREGVNLARRTVAKYREMQNIPSSFQRRRQMMVSGQL